MITESEGDLTIITRTGHHPHRIHTTTQRVDTVGLYNVTIIGFDFDRADVVGGIITMDTFDAHTIGVADETGVIRISRIRHFSEPILRVIGVADAAGAFTTGDPVAVAVVTETDTTHRGDRMRSGAPSAQCRPRWPLAALWVWAGGDVGSTEGAG
jgi:hypothetical protein